jgi:hypothetical protein
LARTLYPGFCGLGWGDVPHYVPVRGAVPTALGLGWFLFTGFLLFVYPGVDTWLTTDLSSALILISFVGLLLAWPRAQVIRGIRETPEGLELDLWLDRLLIPWPEVDVSSMSPAGRLVAVPVWPKALRKNRVLCLKPSMVRELLSSPYSPPVRPPDAVLEVVGPSIA